MKVDVSCTPPCMLVSAQYGTELIFVCSNKNTVYLVVPVRQHAASLTGVNAGVEGTRYASHQYFTFVLFYVQAWWRNS